MNESFCITFSFYLPCFNIGGKLRKGQIEEGKKSAISPIKHVEAASLA